MSFMRIRPALLIVALWALTEPAWARQCSAYVDREKTAVDSAVFVGEVTDVAEINDRGWLRSVILRFQVWFGKAPDYRGYPQKRVTFSVKSSWRGVTTTTIQVNDYSSNFYQVGRDYMVYAYGPMDYLSTDICTRTRKYFGQPDHDLATAPLLPLAPAFQASRDDVGMLGLIGAVVAVAVFWVFPAIRRRRRDRCRIT